jgi:hypothetical protein
MSDSAAAARVLLALELVRRVARELGEIGLEVAPLKGALLAALDPRLVRRPLVDADVLVPRHALGRAAKALARSGARERARSPTAITLRWPDVPLDLDLHGELFRPFLFRLSGAGVLARARSDRALFGAPVRVLDGIDVYAHFVGHFVSGRHNASDLRHVADFERCARIFEIEPQRVAAHLAQHRLHRAARYVMPIAARAGDRFAAEVHAALPSDSVGERLAGAAASHLERHAGNELRALWAVHALNGDVLHGAASLTAHLASGAVRRVSERRRRG